MITEVKIFKLNGESKLKAFANVTFGGVLVVTGFKVIQGEDLFVGMPNKKTGNMSENGKNIYQDIVFPITKEFREELVNAILEKHGESLPQAVEIESQEGFFPVDSDDELPF